MDEGGGAGLLLLGMGDHTMWCLLCLHDRAEIDKTGCLEIRIDDCGSVVAAAFSCYV